MCANFVVNTGNNYEQTHDKIKVRWQCHKSKQMKETVYSPEMTLNIIANLFLTKIL